jgi:hypothetical protein
MGGQARRHHHGQVVQAMQWSGVARAAGDLGSVSSPRREGESRGRLGRAIGRWAEKIREGGGELIRPQWRSGPWPIREENPYSIFQTIFQFANHFEFKSSLNFDDFYLHKMEALHHYEKKICTT